MKKIIAATIGGLGLALVVPQVAHSAAPHHSSEVTYTLAQVGAHTTSTDCWSAVRNGVYDLTGWLPKHPEFAGAAASICGVDATTFLAKSSSTSRPLTLGHHDGSDDDGVDATDGDRSGPSLRHSDRSGHHGRKHVLKSIRPYRIGRLVPVAPSALPSAVPSVAATPAPRPAVVTYTLALIAPHNTLANCWVAIKGGVYDLSGWAANSHPGGAAVIAGVCGTDGTATFTGKHGNGASKLAVLARFKIGVLA